MRKNFVLTAIISLTILLSACGGKASPSSVAKKWCSLNGKVAKAGTDAEKQAAEAARKKYENEIEDKYKTDTAFMTEVGNEIEKCENTSEGK